MSLGLMNISQLREVNEWGRAYCWDIMILSGIKVPAPPAPFDTWFPADSVQETAVSPSSFSYFSPFMQYTVPQNSNLFDLMISFYDNDKLDLYRWFKDWVNNKIFNFDQADPYLSYLQEIVVPIYIWKYRWGGEYQKITVTLSTFWAYPDGPISDAMSSESAARQFSVPLRVCGIQEN